LASHKGRSEAGRIGELEAREHLQSLGYLILAANYRTRFGEIDIVARKDRQNVFVEVKTRRNRAFGLPEEAITAAKARRMAAAAHAYLAREGQRGADWRIDVVVVELGPGDEVKRLEVIENAVGDPRR
jgi:putative endonuclease